MNLPTPCFFLAWLVALSVCAGPAAVVRVEGRGFTVERFDEKARAFSNRDYAWTGVPPVLRGWQFTRVDGGGDPVIAVTPEADGAIFLATTPGRASHDDKLVGWTLVRDWSFFYSTTPVATRVRVFRREGKAGQRIEIPLLGWTRCLVLAPRLSGAPETESTTPDFGSVPGVVIDHAPARLKNYVGCPSIAVLADGRYVASHSFFGGGPRRGRTVVFRSQDRGASWHRLSEVPGAAFSTLFAHRGALYLMGVGPRAAVTIWRSKDGGATWTEPRDHQSGVLLEGGKHHSSTVPMIVHRGRVWRTMEDRGAPGRWPRYFRPFLMSAPVDADLLQAKNWTMSERLTSTQKWLDGEFNGWLEGNAVVGPDGNMANILRVDDWLGGHAAFIHYDEAGQKATFDPTRDIVEMPGGACKFTIRFDPVSQCYWSLVNRVDEGIRAGRQATCVRNTLALISSPDLRAWTVRATILHHPDVIHHGWQYVDWHFDGEDMIAVSRTSFDDGCGGARNQHDANLFTFHRIRGFRKAETMPQGGDTAR
ncbi:MAG: exo-alpha-sialidase [Lentisphaeria bacterium]|nr:exo-alpha-sialidase [Lentisphaeria bacterium]